MTINMNYFTTRRSLISTLFMISQMQTIWKLDYAQRLLNRILPDGRILSQNHLRLCESGPLLNISHQLVWRILKDHQLYTCIQRTQELHPPDFSSNDIFLIVSFFMYYTLSQTMLHLMFWLFLKSYF